MPQSMTVSARMQYSEAHIAAQAPSRDVTNLAESSGKLKFRHIKESKYKITVGVRSTLALNNPMKACMHIES